MPAMLLQPIDIPIDQDGSCASEPVNDFETLTIAIY